MKAYKMFDWDWKCKGFQFEVGKEYTYDGKLEICKSGFHACLKLEDCFKYYKPTWNKIAEVEILGKTETHEEDSKVVTDKIRIVREVELKDVENNIHGGNDIYGGNNIWGGNYIHGGNNIRGGNNIYGGKNIWGGKNCYGVDSAIFVANKKRTPTIFGKKVTQKRFDEVFTKLKSFNWYPKFTNAFDFYTRVGNYWEKVPANLIKPKTNKEAWSDMPPEMLAYIKGLKEFNQEIFKEITEIE